MQSLTIVKGSLSDIAAQSKTSVAESFVSADTVIIVDVSSSMDIQDSRGSKARYQVALEELARLQADLPGKVAVIAFSDSAIFVPGGQPPMMGGGTNLAGALKFAKVADVADMRFIVISDGQPDSQVDALNVASRFRGRIDCVFVGPEWDTAARDFLARLASANGGKSVVADRVQELASKVETLLLE